MKSKLMIYRMLCGVTMVASAAVYLFLLPMLKPFPFVAWDCPMLAARVIWALF